MSISRRLVGTAVLAAALAFPIGVLASHGFTDVPDSNTFHADIDAIADAGVTVGCTPTTYCPKDFVTREQMAAFMNRLGALGPGKTPVVNATKLDGFDSSQFARSDVEMSGQTSCIGIDMNPSESITSWSTSGHMAYSPNGGASFRCQIHLPDGATITAFKAAVHDASNSESVTCTFLRYPHAAASSVSMGSVSTSNAATPGNIVLTTTLIALPSVADNDAYFYATNCNVVGSGVDIGVYAVIVEYTFESIPVE